MDVLQDDSCLPCWIFIFTIVVVYHIDVCTWWDGGDAWQWCVIFLVVLMVVHGNDGSGAGKL